MKSNGVVIIGDLPSPFSTLTEVEFFCLSANEKIHHSNLVARL